MTEDILRVERITTSFRLESGIEVKAISDLSFTLKEGELLGIVGESGSGKSVTALSVMRLFHGSSGRTEGDGIFFQGENLLELSEEAMRCYRGNELSMIFQEPMTALNPVLTIGHQIMEALLLHTSLKKKAAKVKAVDLLRRVRIPRPEQVVDEYPHQLSGGMRQRVMIAMALACAPKILIADEPTTALDVTIQAQIFELMGLLKRDYNTAILMITHDMGVVTELADDVVVMYMGNIIESGTVEEVLRAPKHPYTLGLLRSIPILGKGKNQDLKPIPGATPDPYNRPKGCQFAPRCAKATAQCEEAMPAEVWLPEGSHMVRCWHAKEV